MINVFHSEDFFLYVLVIVVLQPFIVLLQEEPGSFSIISFHVVEDSNQIPP